MNILIKKNLNITNSIEVTSIDVAGERQEARAHPIEQNIEFELRGPWPPGRTCTTITG